jgi:hypothetical protein
MFLALLTNSHGQENHEIQKLGIDIVLGASGHIGGDELAKYRTTVYYDYSDFTGEGSSKITAGGTVSLFIGTALYLTNVPLKLQITGGYYVDRTSDVEDLDSKFIRYPIDVFLYYYLDYIRIGAGLTYHINPTFTEDLYHTKIKFDNALGYYFDIGYIWRSITFSGRYTIIEYGFGNMPNMLKGNNWGLYITFAIKL